MPSLAKKITIDLPAKRLLIDGVEFPWHVSKNGATVENLAFHGDVVPVTLSILAETVEVIPEADSDG